MGFAYCLQEAGIAPANLDCIAFYEKPACKLERALRIGKEYAPSSTANVAAQFPLLINEGMGVELTVRERLNFKGPVYFQQTPSVARGLSFLLLAVRGGRDHDS